MGVVAAKRSMRSPSCLEKSARLKCDRAALVMEARRIDGGLGSMPRRIQLIALSSVAEIILGPPASP